ncbi:MAG: hypothetical protein ACXVB1_09015 [Pseudobdellovibrionaceae bacterium]
MDSNKKFVLEYNIDQDKFRKTKFDDLNKNGISDEWIIIAISNDKKIDVILEAILKQKNSFAEFYKGMRNDIMKYNKFALKMHLRDEAKTLSEQLSKNPSPEKLAELMGIQKSMLSSNEEQLKRHLSLVKEAP